MLCTLGRHTANSGQAFRPAKPLATSQARYPELTMTDITKKISDVWKAMPEEEKNTFKAGLDKQLQAYKTGSPAPPQVQEKVQVSTGEANACQTWCCGQHG